MDESLNELAGLPLYMSVSKELSRLNDRWQASILFRMVLCRLMYGTGARDYAMFGLDGKPLSRIGGYKNKTQTTAYFSRVNPIAERWRTRDKICFSRICLDNGIKTPAIRLVLTHGDPAQAQGFPVRRSFSDVLEYFRNEEDLSLILKPSADSRGSGLRFLRIRNGHGFDMQGRPIDVAEWEADIATYLNRQCYIVQDFLAPDPTMASLGGGRALGTLRILTSQSNGKFGIHFALARIPCGNNIQDSFIGGKSENLIAWVDQQSGVLGPAFGRRKDPDSWSLEQFSHNPETGNPIEGVVVPNWQEIRQLLQRAAKVFEALPVLGWDVGLTTQGAYIIETNCDADIVGAQITSQFGAFDLLPKLH